MKPAALLEIYAFDQRYSVPHWRVVESDPARANEVAQQILDTHGFYHRVEIWLENRQLAQVHRLATSRAA